MSALDNGVLKLLKIPKIGIGDHTEGRARIRESGS